MLYQGWKDTIGQPTVYQHGRRNQITEANSKPGSNKVLDKNFVFIVKIFFEIIFSCDIMFEDKR